MAKHRPTAPTTARLRRHENDQGKGSGDNPKGRPVDEECKGPRDNPKGRPVDEEGKHPLPDKSKRPIGPVEVKQRTSDNPLADRGNLGKDPVQPDEEGDEAVKWLPVGDEEGNICTIPRHLYQLLKPHKRRGVRWLWGLHCNYPGGIVADDMGLGKTLQIAVFLSSLLHSDIIHRGLIIAPVSVLYSWSQELEKKGLSNHFQIYNSAGERGLHIVDKDGGFLVTSYEMYCSKNMILMKSKWNYVVIDEAHKVKNLTAQVREALDTIICNKKILMTGTPITRNLLDMFSLMKFINPNVLGKEKSFRKEYMGPVEMGQYLDSTETNKRKCLKALARCKNMISPYMLRRTKSVLIESGELPCAKHDIIVWLRLTEFQVDVYSRLCKIYDQESHSLSAGEKTAYTHKILGQHICNAPQILLNVLDDENSTSVRRVARRLLSKVDDETAWRELENSCKISFILDLVNAFLEQEKIELAKSVKGKKKLKILMFSQSIDMLDRVQAALAAVMKEGDVIRIDGSTTRTERATKIEQFRSEDGPIIFLLSARVGGEGLNLTAATRVIIIDPSWNISDDNQIADRMYRIGQDEDVTIYRLFTCMTIEEYMYKTQLIKGILAQAVLDGKICSPLVEKKDGRMLRLPKSGFNSSETQEFLESMIGNVLGIDEKHENFLRTHYLVAGLTNQTNVFSHKQMSLPDYIESSDDDGSTSESDAEQSAKFGGRVGKVNLVERKNVLSSSYNFRELRRPTRGAASKQQECALQECMKRIKIPANKVGLVIGRDGGTIARIRTLSSAIIVLNPDQHPNPDPCPIEIRGTPKETQKAEDLIMDIISKVETRSIKDSTSDTVEVDFPVPGDKIGMVIGRNGRIVKELEVNSGASITQKRPENIFRIRGSPSSCDKASAMISEIINKALTSSSRHSLLTEGTSYKPPSKATAPPGRALERSYKPAVQSAVQKPQSAVQEPLQQGHPPSVRSEYYGERGEGYRGRRLPPTSRGKHASCDG